MKHVELYLNDGIIECLDKLIPIYEEKYRSLHHGKEMTYQEVIELLIIGEGMNEKIVP